MAAAALRRGRPSCRRCVLASLTAAALVASTLSAGGAAQAPVRFANLNWHSADVLTSIYGQVLESQSVASVTVGHFNSSGQAVSALRAGEADVVAECWEDCERGDVVTRPLGVQGQSGFYLPNYHLMMHAPFARLLDWNDPEARDLLQGAGVRLLGPPRGWEEDWNASQELAASLGLALETPEDDSDHLTRLLLGLRTERPFAFYMWEPHVIPATYPIQRAALPLRAGGGEYFAPVDLRVVRAASLSDSTAGAVLQAHTWNLTSEHFSSLIAGVTSVVSIRVPDGTYLYAHAVEISAKHFLCAGEVAMTQNFCRPVPCWPRRKDPSYPAFLNILTKNCAPFVVCRENDVHLERPRNGYAIDHLHEVLRMIGYATDEYSIKCGHVGATNDLIANTSRELADLTHACITITSSRQQLVDFSSPFYSTGLRLLVRRPEKNEFDQMFALLKPFEGTTWAILFAFTLLVGVLIGVCESGEHLKRREQVETTIRTALDARGIDEPEWEEGADVMTLSNSLPKPIQKVRRQSMMKGTMYAFQVMSGSKTDSQGLLSGHGRIAMGMLSGVSTVVLSLYTASLAAALTVQQMSLPVTSVLGLKGKQAAIICGTAVETWISTYAPAVQINCVTTTTEMASKVLSGAVGAAVYDAAVLEYMAAEDCRMMVVGEVFAQQEYGIALPRNHSLRNAVADAVTYLREENIHDRLAGIYMGNTCPETTSVSGGRISPSNLVGLAAFFVLALGVAVVRTMMQNVWRTPAETDAEEAAREERQMTAVEVLKRLDGEGTPKPREEAEAPGATEDAAAAGETELPPPPPPAVEDEAEIEATSSGPPLDECDDGRIFAAPRESKQPAPLGMLASKQPAQAGEDNDI